MKYYFAPMEGVTGAIYRTAHHRYFPGVDKYYMPFITPTKDRRLTPRDLRNIAPEHNRGFCAVPQLLTRDADDFCWGARELYAMGYDEVNLNLGCPSGTVTAKGKGAGMLTDVDKLDRFLDGIFSKAEGVISVKTRLGMEKPEEFPAILKVFAQYPISLLIIHPRVRQDHYRHPVRVEEFGAALEQYHGPVCYNGGLKTAQDCAHLGQRFPAVERVMLGQGLLANPALVSQAKGGPGPDREGLQAFHDQLYHSYLEAFQSERNTVYHMKEFWNYLSRLFDGSEKLLKQIRKTADGAVYESAVNQIFRTLPLRQDALWP